MCEHMCVSRETKHASVCSRRLKMFVNSYLGGAGHPIAGVCL